MNRHVWKERIKTGLIVLLSASAVFMLVRIAVYYDIVIMPSFGAAAEESVSADGDGRGYAQCARPLVAAVTALNGQRYGVRYDETAVEELYERYSAALAEALGSAGTPEQVDYDEWEQALSAPGVYFDFLYAQPLGVLASWLGVQAQSEVSEHTAARICLSVSDDEVWLYYIRAKDGLAYKCSTLSTLSTLSADFPYNGAQFVLETEGNDGVDPYTLIVGGSIELAAVNVSNPFRLGIDTAAIMENFGLNSFIARPYTEADGTEVYVDGDATLRLSPDGTVTFRQSGGGLLPVDSVALVDVIDAAYDLADRVSAQYRGDSELMLSSVTYSEDEESFSIVFEYVSNGLTIRLPGGVPAAEITVSGGNITACEFLLREYTDGEETVSPLPEKQAIAMITADGGGEPLLCLIDDGSRVQPGWIVFER